MHNRVSLEKAQPVDELAHKVARRRLAEARMRLRARQLAQVAALEQILAEIAAQHINCAVTDDVIVRVDAELGDGTR